MSPLTSFSHPLARGDISEATESCSPRLAEYMHDDRIQTLGCAATPAAMGTSAVHTGTAGIKSAESVSTPSDQGTLDSQRVDYECVGIHKRLFVCLNALVSPSDEARLNSAGIVVQRIRKFGCMATPLSVLSSVKTWIRQGRVVWLHGVLHRAHWQRPTCATQCCRLAHRAGTPWSIQFVASPWTIKPFELLRRHKYVHTSTRDGVKDVWMASEPVDLTGACLQTMVSQSLKSKSGEQGPRYAWVDDLANCLGEPTKRQQKAVEDGAAIGGLRRPHNTVAQWPTVHEHGAWLRGMIDNLTGVDDPDVMTALATLGQDEVPPRIVELAKELRRT